MFGEKFSNYTIKRYFSKNGRKFNREKTLSDTKRIFDFLRIASFFCGSFSS